MSNAISFFLGLMCIWPLVFMGMLGFKVLDAFASDRWFLMGLFFNLLVAVAIVFWVAWRLP